MIFSIRLEDYILQIALIISSAIKIISVFFFFNKHTYNLPGYFLCYQILSLLALIAAGILAQKKYGLSFFSLGKHFSFSRKIYKETKKLAFGSLFLTVSWILFYELDPYILARFTDPATLAIYAVGLTLLSFYRSIFGALFNPFVARFNHLIGLNDDTSLRGLYLTVIVVMMPCILFAITALFIVAEPFIFSWLGPQFKQSVLPARILICSNIFAFVSYPCAILLIAKQKIRLLYISSATVPVIYWLGILVSYHAIGVLAFAVSKLLAFLVIGFFYLQQTLLFLQMDAGSFIKKYLAPMIVPLLVLIVTLIPGSLYLNSVDKSYLTLFYIIGLIAFSGLCGFICYYFLSLPFRSYANLVFRKIISSAT